MVEPEQTLPRTTGLDILAVWRRMTPELKTEAIDLWRREGAIMDPAQAQARAEQIVCMGRGRDGKLCAVSTAIITVLPRLLQPMYYYRQFIATTQRHAHFASSLQTLLRESKRVLQDYNAGLERAESIGLLHEVENEKLARILSRVYDARHDSVFIGYSPRGLQLRVSYFEGARLLPPVPQTQAHE